MHHTPSCLGHTREMKIVEGLEWSYYEHVTYSCRVEHAFQYMIKSSIAMPYSGGALCGFCKKEKHMRLKKRRKGCTSYKCAVQGAVQPWKNEIPWSEMCNESTNFRNRSRHIEVQLRKHRWNKVLLPSEQPANWRMGLVKVQITGAKH